MYISLDLVSLAAVFWDVTQRLPLFVIAHEALWEESSRALAMLSWKLPRLR